MTTQKKKQMAVKEPKLAKLVVELTKLLDKANAEIGAQAKILSVAEKRRTPKAPPGCESVIHTVSTLAADYGVALPDHSESEMLAALRTVQSLAPIATKARVLLEQVDSASLAATGRAWASATAFYTVLNRVKRSNAKLAKEIAPVSAFFSKRHASKKTKPAKPAAPPVAPAKSGDTGNAVATTPVNGAGVNGAATHAAP
jgi:hypothetical protein